MFLSSLNRQPLAVKLVAVVVLCAFFAISWHVFAAHHTDHIHPAQQCQVCNWMQTAVWMGVSVAFFWALYPLQRVVFLFCVSNPTSFFQSPSGRSPPRR